MYKREQRVLLRHYLEQGLSKQALAERFGVSRRTIYYWIQTGQLDRSLDDQPVRYKTRARTERKLDPYCELIRTRLARYPKLSATRLFEEAQAAGYTGGYTQLRLYVRTVRAQPPPEPVVRFETPPGHQAQVDFAEFTLPWGKRYALLVVLGYSRLLWLKFYPRQTMEVVIRGLEEAFDYFQGVPNELLFDQMKAVIVDDQRPDGGKLLHNAEFARFAAHWRFRIRACRPYRAKTKGKVERPISYVRSSFFYGREFLNDPDLNAQVWTWLERTANQRLHRTTHERPKVRYERDERAVLHRVAARPYRSVTPLDPAPRPRYRQSSPRVERRPLQAYRDLVEAQ